MFISAVKLGMPQMAELQFLVLEHWLHFSVTWCWLPPFLFLWTPCVHLLRDFHFRFDLSQLSHLDVNSFSFFLFLLIFFFLFCLSTASNMAALLPFFFKSKLCGIFIQIQDCLTFSTVACLSHVERTETLKHVAPLATPTSLMSQQHHWLLLYWPQDRTEWKVKNFFKNKDLFWPCVLILGRVVLCLSLLACLNLNLLCCI